MKGVGNLRRKRDDRKLNPSSGGMGRRLNTARTTLRIKATWSKRQGGDEGSKAPARTPSLIGIANTYVIRRLVKGPARATSAASYRPRMRKGLIRTGFAHPKPTRRMAMVPSGSR